MLEDDLTPGEKLYLKRRREKKTQKEVGAELGVSTWIVRGWELDRRSDIPPVFLDGITPAEHYRIVRRRSGLPAREICRRAGFSVEWLFQMERGSVSLRRLIEFWGGG